MAESTVGRFGVREKYCSLAEKVWLISQTSPNERDVKNTLSVPKRAILASQKVNNF